MSSSSDSQVKTISLIIFVLLTVVTSSLAYYFWSQTDILTQQKAEAQKNETKAKQDVAASKGDYEKLRERVGLEPKDNNTALVELIDKEYLQSPKLNDLRKGQKNTYQHFADAVKYLQSELDASDKRITALDAENKGLKDEIKAMRERYDAEVAKHLAAVDSSRNELKSESAKFIAQLQQKDQAVADLRNQFGFLRDENEQLRRDNGAIKKSSDEQKKSAEARIRELTSLNEQRQTVQFQQKDGEIIQLNNAGTEALVDVGLDDGIRKGFTFGVYGRDTGGNPYQLPKAAAEVVSITDSRRSIVRLSSNSLTDPVVPGDLLFNPIWSPGNKERIAIVGRIYMDDDSEPDNEKFMKLVEFLGGKIDAYVDVRTGELKGGDISIQTNWLVVGDIPMDDNKDLRNAELNKKIFSSSNELQRKARDTGVRPLNYRNFLTYMGNQTPTRTVQAGQETLLNSGRRRPALIEKFGQKLESQPERRPAGTTTDKNDSNP